MAFLLRQPAACALLSGVLLILCFPRPQLSLLAWVALAPLLVLTVPRRSRRRLFGYGFLAGAVFFGGTCYWVYDVMRIYGHLSVGAAAVILALFVLALAVYFGVFTLLMGELARRWQLAALVAAPAVWVALEWLRTYFPFGGFPWNAAGYALVPHIGWIQPASYTGIYGLSFLVVAVNALVASLWLAPQRRPLVLLGLVAALLAVADLSARHLPPVPADARALLVQTKIPQQEEFDPRWVEHHPDVVQQLLDLTRRRARRHQPDLVLWPEVPVSFYFHHDPGVRARFVELAQASDAHFFLGIVDFRRPPDRSRRRPTNSAVLLSPDGGYIGQYDKIHLVPFGEYVPLGRWLGFLESLTKEVSDFLPGEEQTVLPAGEWRLGPLICYEAVFPGLSRGLVERGADILVNISNDGWFGRSAAPAQHLAMARLRAVETRRFLLRATNTGITAVIDPLGRVVDTAPQHERAVLSARFAPRREVTFYARHGDWFAALCALVALAVLARKYWMEATEVTE